MKRKGSVTRRTSAHMLHVFDRIPSAVPSTSFHDVTLTCANHSRQFVDFFLSSTCISCCTIQNERLRHERALTHQTVGKILLSRKMHSYMYSSNEPQALVTAYALLVHQTYRRIFGDGTRFAGASHLPQNLW